MAKKKTLHSDSKLIDQMGGTSVVARECTGSATRPISKAAVSKWRRTGIPSARLDYLRVKFPAVFAPQKAAA